MIAIESAEVGIVYWIGYSVLGLMLGSFANVIILRLPEGGNIAFPRSHCPNCKHLIPWYYNIPVLSFIFLKGRCGFCSEKISWRYPIVEFLMGVLFALLYFYFGPSWSLLEYSYFIFALVVCSFIDFDHYILPDVFTLSGIVIGLVGAYLNPERAFVDALLGVLFGGGALWLLAVIYFWWTGQEGMGGGDIKLLGWIGAMAGYKSLPFVLFTSSVTGLVMGLILSRGKGTGLKTVIPFGPFLALGAVLYLLGGHGLGLEVFSFVFPDL